MEAMNALFVNRFASHDLAASQTSVAKLKRKRWRQNERSPVLLFAFYVLLTLHTSPVLSHSEDKNWKTDGNSLSSISEKSLDENITQSDTPDEDEGGTKWASATEEASDERQDAEIFQAVVNSIAEWEERRRIRQAKKKQLAHRPKRSQPEKLDKPEDEEDKEPSKVCYAELGCFQEAGYIDLLPNSPEEVNTRYLLYNSRKSRGDTPLFDVSAQNISTLWEWVGKAFNVSAPTKVIVHGFGSSCSNVWVYEMRSALMSVEDCNIICVDWEAGATIPNYVRAAANTRLVGKQVAILLSGLEKFVNLSLRNVHVIGFSLGAHVAGFAGSELKNLSRITGLDPAGPLFESQDRRARLDSMDAQFVDVIHSNGENLILGGLGAWQPMGHVDFYPNGGRMQKGCTNLFVGAVSDMIWSANEVYGRSLCNHRRAYKFFTDSVSAKCQFPAVPCESYDHFIEGKCFPCENLKDCSNMGFYSDKFSGRGTLYLLTRDEEPFCANQYMVKVENTLDKDLEESVKSTTFGKLQITLIGDLELNETFVITQKKDEKLVSGESVSRIIVPHPALQNFLKIQVQYVAYKGWLSSGQNKWNINKISLTNSYGHVLSACEHLTLESGVPVMLTLIPKDCSGIEDVINFNRTTKPSELEINHLKFPNDFHRDHSAFNAFPHTQVVRIGNEILSKKDSASPAKPNPSTNRINASAPVTDDDRRNASIRNVTRIGVGVTEYMNDPWKQKPEFPEAPSVHSFNDLDGSEDTGEGRRFVFKSARKVNASAANETTAVPVTQPTSKPASEKRTPYEFVTESTAQASPGTQSPLVDASVESNITEPVLKPKPSTTRSRKSPNRPNYGKSMNVHADWGVGSTTDAVPGKRGSSTNESVSNARIGLELDASGDSGNTRAEDRESPRSTKKAEAKNTTAQSFVVQFLPQRLVSFFEQAEKYARMAFSPFISAPESSRANPERARRIRAFGSNRWISDQPPNNKNERLDMESEESRIMVAVVPSPSIRITATSFPYAYQVHQQHLWQPISQLSDHDYKYIPLASHEEGTPTKETGAPQTPSNS